MTELLVTCHRCASVAIRATDDAGRGLCASCYWKREGAYLLHRVRMGIDDNGRPTMPPIPAGTPIGVMVYVAPWPYWPVDYGLLVCPVNRCGATEVGPIVGQPCPWCCDRARNAATPTDTTQRRKKVTV